jgi:23S rRNA (cytidine1920-2'-O)/16S rRNA (cytidine1409-2'-O)-methyltransferase
VGLDFSPIKGPEGNIEYICHLKNGIYDAAAPDVSAIVDASHKAL